MFYLPSQKDIKELKNFNEPYCVSIYAPLIEETGGINPNKVQLKNLLREAERRLISEGVEPRIVRKTTARAREFLKQNKFWHLRDASLALFMHPDFFRYYQPPGNNTPAHVTVGQGFDVEPLQKVLEDDKSYYVLAVSHNNVHLYQCGHYAIKEVVLKDLPSNLKDDLRLDENEHWFETHSVGPASRAAHSEAVHGQYNKKEIDKEELFQFFRHIDSRLHKFLHSKKVPLIFAGVDYLMPIYKKANTYPYLVPQSIKGSPDRKNMNLLRKEAWAALSAK